MNEEQFRKLRAGDTIDVRVTILEFDDDTAGQYLIAGAKSGGKCRIRSEDIIVVANHRVKAGDCVDYGGGSGSGWGVVQSVIEQDNRRHVVVWRYNERDKQPRIISESDVTGRRPLPEGYEWPRKINT